MSRKRAPLIHRPSTDSDIKPLCRSLCLSTDQDEINTLLCRVFDIGISGCTNDALPALLKLILSKLPSSSSDSLTRGLISFISSLPPVLLTKSTTIRLVRWLVRSQPSEPILWISPSPRLLFVEMCCWDTLKTRHYEKIDAISNHLVKMKDVEQDDILASILLVGKSVELDPLNLTSPSLRLLSLIVQPPLNSTLSAITIYINRISSFPSSDFTNSIQVQNSIKLLLYSQTQWIAKIIDLLHNESLFSKLSLFLTRFFPHDEIPVSPTTITRNILSELTHDVLSSHPLSPIQQLVLSSNILQNSKWSSIDVSKFRIFGLLSPLISDDPEKLAESILSDPSRYSAMKSMYMICFAVIRVADAFRAIRYIPGEFWILERAVEVFRPVPIVGKLVSEFFLERICRVYYGSLTMVRDLRIEELLKAEDVSQPLPDDTASINHTSSLSHVGMLRQFIQDQFEYKLKDDGEDEADHRMRLERYIEKATESHPQVDQQRLAKPRGHRIEFTIIETSLKLFLFNPSMIFQEIVCENFSWTITVGLLADQLEKLMAENKESVKAAVDHDEFWNSRKSIDQRLGKIIEEIELKLISVEFRKFLRDFIDASGRTAVELVLPDILLALPIEYIPCLRGGIFVRLVPSLDPWSVELRANKISNRKRYVVNPGGDCAKSEEGILPVLERNGWSGSSGKAAGSLTDDEFTNLLKDSDIFLYSGHGGGEKHWSGSSIQRMRYLEGHGIALLMGCSSAKPYGDYSAPFCTPFHYLIGGYRLVAGTLWDVLGRELDRLTESIVESISVPEEFSIQEAACMIASSREKAKLKFLTSASMVMYGVGI